MQYRDPTTGRTITVERRAIIPAKQFAGQLDCAREQAKLDAAGGLATFTGLYEGDRRVKARLVPGRFGLSWLLHEDERAAFGGEKWLTYGPKSKAQKAKGLKERPELAKAEARIESRRVAVVRTGDPWGGDAQLKFTLAPVVEPEK